MTNENDQPKPSKVDEACQHLLDTFLDTSQILYKEAEDDGIDASLQEAAYFLLRTVIVKVVSAFTAKDGEGNVVPNEAILMRLFKECMEIIGDKNQEKENDNG